MSWRRFIAPLSVASVALVYGNNNNRSQYAQSNELAVKREKAASVIQRFMIRSGAPGLSIGVSVNGHRVWADGFGVADVEQMVPCTVDTVMRIASISKTITAAIAARLVQNGKLDLDANVQKYLPEYPKKEYEGKPVDITIRQLLCHTSGIRHYRKEDRKEIEVDENNNEKEEMGTPEFLSNKCYERVEAALEMFKNDALISKPGSEFNYTTHGYTLLSAVLEKAADMPFRALTKQLFRELGMNHSTLDENGPISPHRARYYYRDRHHKLKNAPEVDNSYKWAGGGMLSNVNDLLIFANAMLYSFHRSRHDNATGGPEPLLQSEALKTFWKGEVDSKHGFRYGLGWYISETKPMFGGANGWTRNGFWMHTGSAVGATSVLLIKPQFSGTDTDGICVAVLVNLHDCGELTNLVLQIAEIFSE